MSHVFERFLDAGWMPNLSSHPCAQDAAMECVLVEPRPHKYLGGVLRNMSHNFPNAALTVIHSAKTLPALLDVLPADHTVRLIPLCPHDMKRDQFNDMLTDAAFWNDTLQSDKVLVYHTDVGIRKNTILAYYEYDYIGAPWSWPVSEDKRVFVGNGGLSLRTRSLMGTVCQNHRRNATFKCPITGDGDPEDVFFARNLVNYDVAKLPTYEVASAFSVEHNFHPDPMGFHKAYDMHDLSSEKVRNLFDVHISERNRLHLTVEDAWIEAQSGRLTGDRELRKWCALGVSSLGLCIPSGSLVPGAKADFAPGEPKYLKLRLHVNHIEDILVSILMQQGRVYDTALVYVDDSDAKVAASTTEL
jgi:hypothetical protein